MNIYESKKKQATRLDSGLLVFHTERPEVQRVHLMIWQPKAIKPYFNYLVKHEDLQKYIDDHNSRLLKYQEDLKQRKLRNKVTPEKIKSLSIGSIFYCSWGYEQTNIDFYQVISIKGIMIEIQAIKSSLIEHDTHDSGKVIPLKDEFRGQPIKKKLQCMDNTFRIAIHSFADAYLWDGKPKYCSWGY